MLKLNRVCIPLTLDCNLHCKYCYRDKEKLDVISEFTEEMKDYLRNLSPDWCEAVVANGGEPFLRFDKLKEFFDCVPKTIHKKILSNCTLLTQEIVDYINENEIELHISHDGPRTKFLRGVDILENPKIRDLIYQVKLVSCLGVITKYNTDCWKNYFDTLTKLGRSNIRYMSMPLMDIPSQHDLIDGFNYEEWYRTYLQVKVSPLREKYLPLFPWYDGQLIKKEFIHKPGRGEGRPVYFNVLPNGIICGMTKICSVYGSVFDENYENIRKKAINSGDMDYCIKVNCEFKNGCDCDAQSATDHTCKCRRLLMKTSKEKYIETRKFVCDHWEEIKEKYGYVEV